MKISLDSKLFRACEWISRFAYVNTLWFLFTLIGFGVFGFVPSTVALYFIVRKWIKGNGDIPIFKTYWYVFRNEFIKSNLLGLFLFLAAFILYVDLAYLPTSATIFVIIRYMIIAVSSVYIVLLFFIFPVYVHFNGSIQAYLKNAVILGLTYPLITFTMLIGTGILYVFLSMFPGIIPFFSISPLAYMIMWLSLQVFNRAEEKVRESQKKIQRERTTVKGKTSHPPLQNVKH